MTRLALIFLLVACLAFAAWRGSHQQPSEDATPTGDAAPFALVELFTSEG